MAKAKSTAISALKFLLAPGEAGIASGRSAPCICVLAGDDAFLRHEARVALTRELARGEDDAVAVDVFDGRSISLRDVRDALAERSLFSSGDRVVVVEDADPFVKLYREPLELLVDKPIARSVLVLEVGSWPANTRLAKAAAKVGLTINCSIPEKGRELTEFTKQLKDWLIHEASAAHQAELKRPAVDLLLELLPSEPGLLLQEVARLALLADGKAVVDAELVRAHVGGWRVRQTWDMIDAAADGRAADALQQLDRLIAAGEEPHALLPQMASTLRRFAAAARIYEQREQCRQPISLRAALEASGMMAFKLSAAEAQLKQIGRQRAKQLYRWLLTADLQLKGHNSTKDRARRVIEVLIVRLSHEVTVSR